MECGTEDLEGKGIITLEGSEVARQTGSIPRQRFWVENSMNDEIFDGEFVEARCVQSKPLYRIPTLSSIEA